MAMIECPACGKEVPDYAGICPSCKFVISHFEVIGIEERKPSVRYPALETIASVYRGLAWTVLVVALLGILVALTVTGIRAFAGAIYMILGGVIGFVTFLAAAEIIKLFIDVEENTRRTVEAVEKKE